jgi:hypothetical protein
MQLLLQKDTIRNELGQCSFAFSELCRVIVTIEYFG